MPPIGLIKRLERGLMLYLVSGLAGEESSEARPYGYPLEDA